MTSREKKLQRDLYLCLVMIAAICLLPIVSSSTYWMGAAILAMYFAMMATSWNLLGGFTGQFSLAPAAFALIGAYSVALPYTYLGLPNWLCIILAPFIAGSVGFLLGRVTLRLDGPYFALSTLGFGEILRLLVTNGYQFTRGDLGMKVPLMFEDRIYTFYTFAVVLTVIVIALYLFLRSKFGLFVEATRDDEIAAKARGIPTVRWKTTAFAMSSAIGGLAGAMHASYVSLASPEIGLFLQSGLMIAMVVVGGMTTLSGPILGAFLLYFTSEILRESPINYMVIFSFLIIIFARFFPSGLVGIVTKTLGAPKSSVHTPLNEKEAA